MEKASQKRPRKKVKCKRVNSRLQKLRSKCRKLISFRLKSSDWNEMFRVWKKEIGSLSDLIVTVRLSESAK